MNDELRRRDLGLNYYCVYYCRHSTTYITLQFTFPSTLLSLYLNVPESKPSKRVDPWVNLSHVI
jgi:hypothetical protein